MSPVRPVVDAQAKLGEGPCWDAARQWLWFVDIKRHRLWHHEPATGATGFTDAGGQIGWALPAENGRLLCGIDRALHIHEPASGRFEKLLDIPGEPMGNRLNDACTDPWGRVWFGSMDDSETAASGRYYLFDRGTVWPAGPAGIRITNGPAASPDGRSIYFTDTLGKRILVAALTEEGVGEARLFADTAAHFPGAYPDGPVVDSEGHVWTGLYLGGCVARYAPDGRLVEQVPMPARDITKIAFGGPDLRTVYVTTATKNLEEPARTQWPMSGQLLAFDCAIAGAAPALVKLS